METSAETLKHFRTRGLSLTRQKESNVSSRDVKKSTIGDGDSKGFNEIENTHTEPGLRIVKIECVEYVQKQVSTTLRKLKKDKKGMTGSGKLTDTMIDRLQNYYGIAAIRRNVDKLQGMKEAIHASLMLCASSKDSNSHHHCPKGGDGWCCFNMDIANKTKSFKPDPY